MSSFRKSAPLVEASSSALRWLCFRAWGISGRALPEMPPRSTRLGVLGFCCCWMREGSLSRMVPALSLGSMASKSTSWPFIPSALGLMSDTPSVFSSVKPREAQSSMARARSASLTSMAIFLLSSSS